MMKFSTNSKKNKQLTHKQSVDYSSGHKENDKNFSVSEGLTKRIMAFNHHQARLSLYR